MKSIGLKQLLLFVVLASVGILVIFFLIPKPIAPEPVPVVDAALVERGVEVYLASYCGACHELAVADTHGMFGPAHNQMAAIAQERIQDAGYNGDSQTPEDYIRESILSPQVYMVPEYIASSHAMPAFTHLSEADIDAMVYMLAHQN